MSCFSDRLPLQHTHPNAHINTHMNIILFVCSAFSVLVLFSVFLGFHISRLSVVISNDCKTRNCYKHCIRLCANLPHYGRGFDALFTTLADNSMLEVHISEISFIVKLKLHCAEYKHKAKRKKTAST
jgi:hypothetical protein